jgi:hypothetical protein
MASERQLQDRGKSSQEDSLGIEDAQQVTDQPIILNSPTNLDPKDELEHLEQVKLLTTKLKDNLNSVDTSTTVD